MRRSIALSLLLAVPAGLAAQDTVARPAAPGSYTRMLLGAGGTPGSGLTFMVGLDHKKAASKLGLRVVGEYREHGPTRFSYASREIDFSKTYGLQLLGMRPFREGRRIEPYMFAGLGIYHNDRTYYEPISGAVVRRRETSPELLWGLGANVRVLGMTLFGDVKLPTWGGPNLSYGQAGTFKIGFRF
jgi:hypothetical protein